MRPILPRLLSGILPSLPLLAFLGCAGGDAAGPEADVPTVPGPGPHYSVAPIPLEHIARIVPIGSNGKVFPIGHSYWRTCDLEYLLPGDAPCLRDHLPIRAPGDGVVIALDPAADGEITIEGPPGLRAGFAHVTPAPGLRIGDRVRAGDTIATMFADHVFDFQLTHLGIPPHEWARPERYIDAEGYRYAQTPIAQYPEPLRSQLLSRVRTEGDPLGRLSYDVVGTAAGNWFRPGIPMSATMDRAYEDGHLFLGRLLERPATRVVDKGGDDWFPPGFGLGVVDPAAPSWTDITPGRGPVQLRLWALARDGRHRDDLPYGSVLVEMPGADRLRIEWFDTHDTVASFTAAALTYER